MTDKDEINDGGEALEMNGLRASWALEALNTFSSLTGAGAGEPAGEDRPGEYGPTDTSNPEMIREAMIDLVADLGHLANLHGIDFKALIEGGISNYLGECKEAELSLGNNGLEGPEVTLIIGPYASEEQIIDSGDCKP